ncbi:MAG: MFS transporter, partial [Candidatus Ranarchaeia archaeon]
MSDTQKMTRRGLLVFILISHFFDHVYNNILSPLFPLIQMEIPMTYTEISILGLISSFFLFLFQAQFGGLSDRVGPKYIIAFSMIFDGLAMITTGFANTFVLLLIAQLAFGVGISAFHPPCFSALQSNYPKNAQGKVMSYFGVAANIGNSLAPVLSVSLALALGSWRYGLWVISIMGLAWGLIVLVLFPAAQVKKSKVVKEKTSIRDKIPKLSIIALILFINTARGAVYRSVTQFTSLIFTDVFSFSALEASGIFTLVSVVGAIFSLMGGVLADRTSRRLPIIIGQIAGVVCIVVTAFTTDPLVAIIGFLGMGAAIFIGFGGIQAYTSDVTPKGNVGFSWGLIMGLQVLTRSLMLIPFGLIGDLFNLRSSLLFLAIVLGIG